MNGSLRGQRGAAAALLAGVRRRRRATSRSACRRRTWRRSQALLAGSADRAGARRTSRRTTQGAYTGEVSAAMLAEFGCATRSSATRSAAQYHGETDAAGGREGAGGAGARHHADRLRRRDAGRARSRRRPSEVVKRQLDAVIDAARRSCIGEIVVAYEPVWAIGTGKTATPEQAQAGARVAARAARRAASDAARRVPHPLRRQHEGRTTRRSCSRSPTSTAA